MYGLGFCLGGVGCFVAWLVLVLVIGEILIQKLSSACEVNTFLGVFTNWPQSASFNPSAATSQ